ncbi:MAG: tyrosine-type recombinase/integrase [Alphaproteobacteria bacterium]|nr:tyrosine-type recombinase/integrase [Alphaproteobacteria bacterium]
MLNKLDHRSILQLEYKDKDYTVSDGGNLYVHVRKYRRKEWLFRYVSPVTGKRRNCGFGSFPEISLKDARNIAGEKRALLDQNLDPIIEEQKKIKAEIALHHENKAIESNTVKAVFYEWKKAELKNRKDRGEEIERSFIKDVFPFFDRKPISEIVRDDIKKVLGRPLNRGSNRMANRMLSDLRQFFSFALDEEYIEKDPTARMRKDRVGGKEEPRTRFLSKKERKMLAEILPESGLQEKYQLAVWIMLATGCRVQELSKTKWENIDFSRRIYKIPAPDAKNKKMHKVYLSDFALKKFNELYQRRTSEIWAFPSRDGETYTNRRTISKQITDRQQLENPIEGRCKDHCKLVLPNGHWTAHDLRRTAATTLQELGFFPHIVKKCLNQTVDDPIVQTYQQADLEEKQKEAFEKLGEYLEGLFD